MKKLLMVIIGAAVLSAHSTMQEETRRRVREYIEEFDADFSDPYKSMHSARRRQLLAELQEIGLDVRMSVYLEIIEEAPDAIDAARRMIKWCSMTDGQDIASYGNQKALDWARKLLSGGTDDYMAQEYLLRKGDARDLGLLAGMKRTHEVNWDNLDSGDTGVSAETLEIFKRVRDADRVWGDYGNLLAARVAGTNIINAVPDPWAFLETHWMDFIPSVTNTGPQGLYVEAILRQYWENMSEETYIISPESGRTRPFRDRTKIPTELLTLVVWFDDGGNPVCNVDLAKHGLTMPELDVPNRPKGKAGMRDEESGIKSEKSRTRRLWLYALIIPAALAALLLARRRRR